MKKSQVYLAGAIQAAPDQGKRWRTILSQQLFDLGFKVFNPCERTDGPILERFGWKKFAWDEIKKPDNREQYLEVMREIVNKDLTAMLESDIIVVYFDRYVQLGAGTYGEMTVATWHNMNCHRAKEKIPVYVVLASDMEFNSLPGWIVGCTDKVFDSFKTLVDYLEKEHA